MIAASLAPGKNIGVDATIVPLIHPYFLNFSTNWGTGFALPIAVYALFIENGVRRFLIWVGFAGVVLALADPIHVFPALGTTVIGLAVLFRKFPFKNIVVGLMVYSLMSFALWHEFLFVNVLAVEVSNRGYVWDLNLNFLLWCFSECYYLLIHFR